MVRRTSNLINFGIVFTLSVLLSTTLGSGVDGSEEMTYFTPDDNSNNINISTYIVSGKIHINGDSGWAAAKSAGICVGEGTFSDPYIIENYEIHAGYSGSCVFIENSIVHFRIENCYVFSSGFGDVPEGGDAGITLSNVQNGELIKNECTSDGFGIFLFNSSNNTISNNIIHRNEEGIFLKDSNHNEILLNTIYSNFYRGIVLWHSSYNTIIRNSVSRHELSGIRLSYSDYNMISLNTINSGWGGGILLKWSNKNAILSNFIIPSIAIDCLERDSMGNVYLFNTGKLFYISLFLKIFVLSIFTGRRIKKRLKLKKRLH